MTRDEAVAIAKKSKDDWGGGSSELWLVNALVALGMLELDEPKNAEQEFSTMLYGYINGPDADAILGGMSQRGLKIVKA